VTQTQKTTKTVKNLVTYCWHSFDELWCHFNPAVEPLNYSRSLLSKDVIYLFISELLIVKVNDIW